jgi:hypothetical protein
MSRKTTKTWHQKHPDRLREYRTKYRKANHKRCLTWEVEARLGKGAVEHFDVQLVKQKQRCAICKKPLPKRKHRDHKHSSGKWRGVLCTKCNTWLAPIEDKHYLKKALKYIKKWEN